MSSRLYQSNYLNFSNLHFLTIEGLTLNYDTCIVNAMEHHKHYVTIRIMIYYNTENMSELNTLMLKHITLKFELTPVQKRLEAWLKQNVIDMQRLSLILGGSRNMPHDRESSRKYQAMHFHFKIRPCGPYENQVVYSK